MKIAVTSQNFRTITGHAGKTRRFLVFDIDAASGEPGEPSQLDLPKSMSLHEYHGDDHPVFDCDLLITAGCGDSFRERMARHGVETVATSATDPVETVRAWLRKETLPPAAPHEHSHDHHGHGHGHETPGVSVDSIDPGTHRTG
jgi:predicted Fe-Mo cluster-binding NifX family protein